MFIPKTSVFLLFLPYHKQRIIASICQKIIFFSSRRRFSAKTQTIVLGILSFSGIAAIIFNLVTWGSPYEYLPLHLCSLTAMVLPIAVFTRSNTLRNLLLLWSLDAVMALVVNSAQANFEIFSSTFFFYYFPHLLEFGIPILLFRLGLVEKDVKCIGSTLLITLCVYTLIHLANVSLNSYFLAEQILNPSGAIRGDFYAPCQMYTFMV